MSFSRHGEIYRPMGASKQSGEPAELGSPAHRYDESPAGYSSAGWSPPEPASASPAAIRMRYSDPAGRDFCSERRTVSYSVVSAEGSTPTTYHQSRLFTHRKSPSQISLCLQVGSSDAYRKPATEVEMFGLVVVCFLVLSFHCASVCFGYAARFSGPTLPSQPLSRRR
jgi:hypothetical protein